MTTALAMPAGNHQSKIINHKSIHAFTLIELLVVITIIGILIALLLPAVQAAREAARRMQCTNNLKQLALALHNYHDQWNKFPPSSVWRNTSTGQLDASTFNTSTNTGFYENWVIMILPFLDQQPLHDKFDLTTTIAGSAIASNVAARAASLSLMLCPSDSFNRKPFNGTTGGSSIISRYGDGWARGNYASNAGLGSMNPTWANYNISSKAGWGNKTLRGVMGANQSLNIVDITDGTSCTFLLGEIRAGVVETDLRGVWALTAGGASSLWCYGSYGDDNGPNPVSVTADDINGCNASQNLVGGQTAMAAMGMGCSEDGGVGGQLSVRSLHIGGVHMAFCDGSVRWISDYIQHSGGDLTAIPPRYTIWDRLCLSADGQIISGNAY